MTDIRLYLPIINKMKLLIFIVGRLRRIKNIGLVLDLMILNLSFRHCLEAYNCCISIFLKIFKKLQYPRVKSL